MNFRTNGNVKEAFLPIFLLQSIEIVESRSCVSLTNSISNWRSRNVCFLIKLNSEGSIVLITQIKRWFIQISEECTASRLAKRYFVLKTRLYYSKKLASSHMECRESPPYRRLRNSRIRIELLKNTEIK